MKSINNGASIMHEENLVPLNQIWTIQNNMTGLKASMWQVSAAADKETLITSLNQVDKNLTLIKEQLDQYYSLPMTTDEQKIVSKLKPAMKEYEAALDQFSKMNRNGESSVAFAPTVGAKRAAVEGVLQELLKQKKDAADKIDNNNAAVFSGASRNIILLTIFAFLLTTGLGVFISRQIAVPLGLASLFAGKIANRDLSMNVREDFLERNDEIGDLGKSMDQMTRNLRELIENIARSAQETASLSEELSATCQDVSSHMEEVTASIEEISSGLETVSSSTQEINASSEEMTAALTHLANESQNGTDMAMKSEAQAKDIQDQAHEANQQTIEIYKVIKVNFNKAIEEAKIINEISSLADTISNIAAQTNLLALNAAIEAARAGDQGRGFSVVADEVRKLAEESSVTVSSIKQMTDNVQVSINNLISNSNNILQFINDRVIKDYGTMVNIGKKYANDANTYNQMTSKMTNMSNQIVSAVNEVSKAIETVAITMSESAKGVNEIAKGAQNTNISVVGVAESSAKLAENGQMLTDLIGKFKI
jgi:methyl-accepting chemotaxis protein